MKHIVKATTTAGMSEREKRHASLAREAAGEGFVLLKNDGVLPLKTQTVALFGSGGRNTIVGGTGSGEMHQRYDVSIEEGLKNAGIAVTTENYLTRFENHLTATYAAWKKDVEEKAAQFQNIFAIMEVAANNKYIYPTGIPITDEDLSSSATDTAIYVLSRQAGEGRDRLDVAGEFRVDGIELENLNKICEYYRNVILVINAGGVIDLSFADDYKNIKAIIFYAQGGMEGGNAFADVVTGKVNPSGKLTMTWAEHYSDYPEHDTYSDYGDRKEQNYREGIYIGYRYFDSFHINPRYEFGYGLSYTNFEIKVTSVKVVDESVIANVTVTNTGSVAGKEVVQAYVTVPYGKTGAEYQRLVAFCKTVLLKPDETQCIEMKFALADCAVFDEKQSAFVLNEGDYILRVGNSSRKAVAAAKIVLDKDAVVEKVDHICPMQTQFEEYVAPERSSEELEGLLTINVDTDTLSVKMHVYDKPPVFENEKIKEVIEKLSVEELATLVNGSGLHGNNMVSALGASGYTTSELYEKYGIPNLVLADGPAGINMAPEVVLTENEVKPMQVFKSYDLGAFGAVMRARLGKAEEGVVHYQYATAWPCSMLLASTWNTALLERIGDATGEEMVELGVTVWLAPGMNLYRNPLCGRTFEYYTEEPLVAGKMAAAITRGVQSHKGTAVSIKHYLCNNHEYDREYSSSNLSERALRELYLRAFRIAVEEGKPGTVMASYNKINGVYSTNNYDTLVKTLRNEWGFNGLVMSDWNAVDLDRGDVVKAMQAQCDLIMPGKTELKDLIIKGVESGELALEDLQRCAARVLALIAENVACEYKL